MANHITRAVGIIAKLRHFISKNTLKLIIYYALAYPHLTCGNMIWEILIKPDSKKIFEFSKEIGKLTTFESYSQPSKPLFFELKILNIFKINDYLCVILSIANINYKRTNCRKYTSKQRF